MVNIQKYIIFTLSIFYYVLPYNESLDVITTNDMHGAIHAQEAHFINPNHPPTIIGGSGFIHYVNNLREELNNDKILLLDGGNFFQGHPIGIVDSGRTMIEWMNKVGYHAIVPGNNDFLFGLDNLIDLSKKADFSFLAANLFYEDSNALIFKPYEIIEFNDVKVGVIGIVNPDLENLVLPQNIKNIQLKNPVTVLENIISDIKNEVDILILLTSAGVPWEREKVYNEFIVNQDDVDFNQLNAIELGYYASGIDIVVSGGISKGYPEPWYDPNSHIYTFQNYGGGTSFGHFIMKYDNKTKLFSGYESAVTSQATQTLFINDFRFDHNIYDWILDVSEKANNEVYQPIDWTSQIVSDGENASKRYNSIKNNWNIPSIDVKENIDIITWNCEFFPTADQETIDALSEAIYDLDVDIIAFQEIKKNGWFDKLMKLLPNYEYIISEQSSFMNQAIIYKRDQFRLVRKAEPFAENDYNFAGRPPLRADLFRYSDSNYYSIINLHMKCCDSGLNRRKNASKMLYEYISNEVTNGYSNFIVLGDWNDDLKDSYSEHCFTPFLEDDRFHFVTEKIVDDLSQASYPKEPYFSFLDHILVTNTLIPRYSSVFEISTINMGDYMGGYDIYEKFISDHLPVLLSF